MTEYSKNNDGIIAKGAGLGGRINTAVGGAVEGVAQKGKKGNSDQSMTGQFVDANKQVLTAATGAVSTKSTNGDTTVLKAQKRLGELGYDVGSPDGIMGNRTKVAIGRFQTSKGLPASRILDSNTLSALGIQDNQ